MLGIALCFAGLSIFLWSEAWSAPKGDPIMDGVDAPKALKDHAALYEGEQIVKVRKSVFISVFICSCWFNNKKRVVALHSVINLVRHVGHVTINIFRV